MFDDEEFGDFDEYDVADDLSNLTDEQWQQVADLEMRVREINEIEDRFARKLAAKMLVQELNGEQ